MFDVLTTCQWYSVQQKLIWLLAIEADFETPVELARRGRKYEETQPFTVVSSSVSQVSRPFHSAAYFTTYDQSIDYILWSKIEPTFEH